MAPTATRLRTGRTEMGRCMPRGRSILRAASHRRVRGTCVAMCMHGLMPVCRSCRNNDNTTGMSMSRQTAY